MFMRDCCTPDNVEVAAVWVVVVFVTVCVPDTEELVELLAADWEDAAAVTVKGMAVDVPDGLETMTS